MTASERAGASPACYKWNGLPWSTIEKQVNRLQVRIAKATREGKKGKASALQRILTHSFYAKCLAIKRVTGNKGAKTPGVDGILWRTKRQKMKAVNQLKARGYKPQPLRRIYIPKRYPKTGKRPLSIPCMQDRAMQALWQLALCPVAEVGADPNSYGFRPKRSVADAIEQTFAALSRRHSPQWVYEGDIRACFDKLSHAWLLENIPMDKTILSKFLKAGFMEKRVIYPTAEGTPQGGIISPTLTLMALAGLEKTLKGRFKKADKVNVVIYADDFIITCACRQKLEEEIIPQVERFLKQRGLEISQEKSKITHIREGFDFLGHHIRKYEDKLLIKPSKANIKRFLGETRKIIKGMAAAKTENMIGHLNSKILGWAHFYRHVVSSRTFSYIDHEIFNALQRWALKRHPNRGRTWLYVKYFRKKGHKRWQFFTTIKSSKKTATLDLVSAEAIPIRRHIKIKGAATPYDPQYKEYFAMRACCKTRAA